MSESRKIYETVISHHVQPYLEGLGFQPRKPRRQFFGSFEAWNDDCLASVSCVFQKDRSCDQGWISVYVGVGFRSIAEFLKDFRTEDLAHPNAMGTRTDTIRRIEHLVEGPPWPVVDWHVLPESRPEVIGPEVVQEIQDYALAFFSHYGSLEKSLAAWKTEVFFSTGRRNGHYQMAAAYWLRGQPERAKKFISDLLEARRRANPETFTPMDDYARFLEFLENKTKGLRLLKIQPEEGRIQEVRTTDSHPFWVKQKGKVVAGDLKPGDVLVQSDGSTATVLSSIYQPYQP